GGGRGTKGADPLPRRRSAGGGSGGIRAIGGGAAATKKIRAGAFSRCPGISLRREQPAREIRTGAQQYCCSTDGSFNRRAPGGARYDQEDLESRKTRHSGRRRGGACRGRSPAEFCERPAPG